MTKEEGESLFLILEDYANLIEWKLITDLDMPPRDREKMRERQRFSSFFMDLLDGELLKKATIDMLNSV